MTKLCIKCRTEKTINQFNKNKSRKDGLQAHCKDCYKKYYRLNIDKFKKQNVEYYKTNSTKIKESSKKYYITNTDKVKEREKKHRRLNFNKIKEYKKEYVTIRRKQDPLFKFCCNIRTLIGNSFKRKSKNFYKQSKTATLLGCTIPELRDHLAKQFQEGMTFENHGQWHVDHRIPLASAKTQEEIEKLCHYTNLQPLWAADNIRKGKKK